MIKHQNIYYSFRVLKSFSIVCVVHFAVYFLCYTTIAIAIIYYESEVESMNVQMKATSTFVTCMFASSLGNSSFFTPKLHQKWS